MRSIVPCEADFFQTGASPIWKVSIPYVNGIAELCAGSFMKSDVTRIVPLAFDNSNIAEETDDDNVLLSQVIDLAMVDECNFLVVCISMSRFRAPALKFNSPDFGRAVRRATAMIVG